MQKTINVLLTVILALLLLPRRCRPFYVPEANDIAILPNTNEKVLITEGENDTCIHSTRKKKLAIVTTCKNAPICKKKACLKKCCKFDEKMISLSCQPFPKNQQHMSFQKALSIKQASNANELKLPDSKISDYMFQVGFTCNKIRTIVKSDEWQLTSNGKLKLNGHLLLEKYDNYCIDLFGRDNSKLEFALLICGRLQTQSWFKTTHTLTVINCIFIFMTIVIYKILPKLMYLYDMCLLSHLSFLLIGLSCTLIGSANLIPADFICKYWGYLTLFFIIYAFSWLNTMFFDVWKGIRRMTSIMNVKRANEEPVTICIYCLYSCAYACTVVLITITFDHIEGLKPQYKPMISGDTCWFQIGDNYGLILYCFIPIIIQMIFNIYVTILSGIDCYYIQIQINTALKDSKLIKQKSFNEMKEHFYWNLKLLIINELPIFLKAISDVLLTLLYDSSWVYYFVDFSTVYNLIQGILIFVIMLLDPKVRKQLRSKLCKKNSIGRFERENRIV